MKFKQYLPAFTLVTLAGLGINVFAQGTTVVSGVNLVESDWFSAGAAIQDLRERSTETFDLLDVNQSRSITFDEIDLTEMSEEVANMTPEELRDYRRRSSAIHSKFMNWATEIDEFEVVDTNNDGVWNEDEYEVRHQNVQSERLKLGLAEWDADGNGAVELHEFNSHLDELELLDKNGDGTVSHQEAFESEDKKVISDVLLNKLRLDGAVWNYSDAATIDVKGGAEAEVRYNVIHTKLKTDSTD